MSDWDAIIGEAALGLDLARVDAARNRPGPDLARRAVAVLDRRPEPIAIDPGAIFREEALEFRARGRDVPGGVVRLGSHWLTWAYRVTLVLLAAAIASLWVIRTSESTTGPVAVDGRTGTVTMVMPAAAGADLAGARALTVVLADGRSMRVTGLHAALAGDAAIRNAGFTPLSQPALLVTGRLNQSGPEPQHSQATVILRSETVADVLGRQFDAMLGQGTGP